MNEIRVRLAEVPEGGARVAWSYLAAVLGAVLAGLFWVAWTPFSGLVCSGPDDVLCVLGWEAAGGILGGVGGLAVAAFVLRLGWEWWLIGAAVLLGAPLWFDTVPVWARVVVLVLTPALAAVATWSGPRRPAWRPWAIGGLGVVLIALGVLSILV